ncbi:hypothetical protein CW751_12335 [Brumimicrobium salinarum]|uniref:DUF1684 domain-containing protein n=1 Tax=Brumimicrobium salinarum TaxID=2058658 RepID=A0A2I0R0D8_9FLAO|nr:DUF1684 domain-containing protein [Brumimicrobium salinarum]PKR80005.1 hypothetical protein CW751_12335 [Brumimicrobium salinarum]
MNIKTLFLAVLIPIGSFFAQDNYLDEIKKERSDFEQKLLHTDSILNTDEQKKINKLNYFPIDSTWVLTAKFKKKKGKTFGMPTTTGRTPKYKRIGYLHFKRNKEKFKLAVYKNLGLFGDDYKNLVFVPFKDANAPEVTYGGGRYLDLEIENGVKHVRVDFNKAYNPYCVYSYRYSCPITPEENHIDVKINAGVKNPN